MRRLPALPIAFLALGASAPGQGIHFNDVSAEAGLDLPTSFRYPGAAAGDFDGDGWVDLCFANAAEPGPRIFRNNGAARAAGIPLPWFTEVTQAVLPGNRPPASHVLFADLDRDGDLDLVAARWHPTPLQPQGDPNYIGAMFYEYRDGMFFETPSDPSLGRSNESFGGMALSDTDRDGDLDLLFLHHEGPSFFGGAGFHLRNTGGGHFVDETAFFGGGLAGSRHHYSPLFADFDGDRLVDFHAAVDFGPDLHGRNQGAGVFVDVATDVGADHWGQDMGLAVGDVEGDGDLDLFATNVNSGVLHINDGAGRFRDEALQRGCGDWGPGGRKGWGTVFSDFDHDGDLDLCFVSYADPGILYSNRGDGHFLPEPGNGGLDLVGHGLLDFDYDRDGDRDLLVVGTAGDHPRLYENDSPDLPNRNWLVVRAEGHKSNRSSVGAWIEVTAGGTTQVRTIVAGSSYLAGLPLEAHFGLGGADRVDRVLVRWPTGIVRRVDNVGVGRELRVEETVR